MKEHGFGIAGMRKWGRILLLALAGAFLLPLLAAGAPPPRKAPPWTPPPLEKILRFHSLIQAHLNSTLTITETIRVESAGIQIRRGIVREFPTTYKDRAGNTVTVAFQVLEALRDGQQEPYRLEHAANGVRVYIGRKDVTLPPGQYEYTLKYRADRQVGFFQNYDEIYWNVTGNGWRLPILRAQAEVEPPPGARVVQRRAYTGPWGAKGEDFQVREEPGRVVFTTTRDLPPGSGLTVAVAWPKGIVRPPSALEKLGFFLRDHLPAGAGALGFLAVLGFYLVSWNRVGRDPEKGVIIPLYGPPPGFSPPAARFLMEMGFDDRTVAAALVDMAVKGYLTIENVGQEYALHKRGGGAAALSQGEQELGARLFAGSDTLEMKNQNHAMIQEARKALEKTLGRELEKSYFAANANYFSAGLILSVLALGAVIITSMGQAGAGHTALWLLGWTIALGAVAYFFLNYFPDAAGAAAGVIKALGASGAVMLGFALLGLQVVGFFIAQYVFSLTLMVLLAALIVLNLLFYRLLKAPTLTGRKVMDQIEGFKLYLTVAEKDRLNLLNPPERTPELFERYLPYALALEVENEWGEQFAEVLARAGAGGQPYTPVWYTGSYHGLGNSRFVSDLGGAFPGAISSSAAAPGSDSGSGGGGFSGGGGGGGGGGGW